MRTAGYHRTPSEHPMNVSVGRLGALGAALPFLVLGLAPAALPDNNALQPGVRVPSAGPVHEAFARPLTLNPQPNPMLAQQPPEPILEALPDQKPEGPNVQWIPGYWSWDPTQKEFIWISGFWRVPPPNRQWIP